MEKITDASSTIIPTVDLSPFIDDDGDEYGRKKAMDTIYEACKNLGVFEIENDGDSLDLCVRFMELSKTFFRYPEKVKKLSTALDYHVSGTGYYKGPAGKYHDFEYVLMHSPKTFFNGVPTIQSDYRKTFKAVYSYFLKTSQILEKIINDCLGLPPNLLTTHNDDRSSDYLLAMHYTPSTKTGEIGIAEHEDPNVITIILQDEVCGLEVQKGGEWIPVIPTKGKLIVVVGDLIQDLSNKKFRSVTHRALKHKGKHRHAIDFCYNMNMDKWIEPLPELSLEIGVKPKYKGFLYKDYIDLKVKDEENPPATPDDFIDLKYYEI